MSKPSDSKILNNILKGVCLYAVEYSGIFRFKFSISSDSFLKNYYDFIRIEIVSDCKITIDNQEIQQLDDLFSLVGNCIYEIDLTDEKFILTLENNYKIIGIKDNHNPVFSRFWEINFYKPEGKPSINDSYILNDFYDTIYSQNLLELLKDISQ